MRTVTLQFQNILELLDFLEITKTTNCEVNRRDLIVICELSQADTELAVRSYRARLLS